MVCPGAAFSSPNDKESRRNSHYWMLALILQHLSNEYCLPRRLIMIISCFKFTPDFSANAAFRGKERSQVSLQTCGSQ